MPRIHPTAIVDPTAELASSATVGAYCVIGPRVTIGEDTELRPHAHICALTKIGKGNTLHPYSLVGGDPQDLKWHGEPTWLEIGDFNQVREHATIHRGTGNGGGTTTIGSHNLFMANSHVAHDCRIGNHTILANNVMLAGHVQIEDFANIGGAAGVHHFCRVGYCSFIGAMSRVPKDVPPFMLVEGHPAAVRGFNHIAMSRAGMNEAEIEAMKEAYKRLFRARGGSMPDKLESLQADFPNMAGIARLAKFLALSNDGVHGRALENHRTDDKRATRPVRK